MENQPIDVVGAGFVPGIVGVWGNNTIPADEAGALLLFMHHAPDAPSPLPSVQGPPASESPVQEVNLLFPTPPSASDSGE